MKYLIIVQNYPPEIGAVRYTFDLANALYEQGHSITIITGIPHYPTGCTYTGYSNNDVSVKNENGIEVVRVPLLLASNTQPLKRILGFITFFFSAIPYLLKNKDAQLLIVSIPPLNVLFLGILAKLMFRTPFISLLRDFEPYSSFNTRKFLTNNFFFTIAKLFSKLYNYSDAVVVVHSDQISTIQKLDLHFKNLKLLPHPFKLLSSKAKKSFDIKSNRNYSPKYLRGIYIGTFGRVHALPLLIKTLNSNDIPSLPIDFIFIGDGEEKQKCEELLLSSDNQHIKIFGSIPFELVEGELMNADFLIFSLASDIEIDGVGSKFYEYLAACKPILVCGKSAATDVVNRLRNGWTIEYLQPETLYTCLIKVLDDKPEFSKIGNRSLDYLNKIDNQESFGKSWNNLCESIINNK